MTGISKKKKKESAKSYESGKISVCLHLKWNEPLLVTCSGNTGYKYNRDAVHGGVGGT